MIGRAKVDPRALVALRNVGFNNSEIAKMLRIHERSVRRGLDSVGYEPSAITKALADLARALEQ